MDKILRKTLLKELNNHTPERIPNNANKRFKLAEKISQKELWNPKKHNNEKPLAYITTYNKNNPQLFTEIIKNLEELKNNAKIEETLDTTKVIKSQRWPQNFKRILISSTFGENTSYQILEKNDIEYVK